ncbi:hypothetical protein DRP07_08420 [Archaeoglobales archaeon]|nr:MAG: hypothetical protein DRP07_08420 [Archaeoglobales archaeon]
MSGLSRSDSWAQLNYYIDSGEKSSRLYESVYWPDFDPDVESKLMPIIHPEWVYSRISSLDTQETSQTEDQNKGRKVRVRRRTKSGFVNVEIDFDEWVRGKKLEVERCGKHGILMVRDCGAYEFAICRCKNPLCPVCSRIDSLKLLNRYLPALREFDNPLFITLTYPSKDLKSGVDGIKKSFSRLMDMRIGSRKMKSLEVEFYKRLEKSNLDENQRDLQVALFKEFKDKAEAVRKKLGRSPKLRDILNRGIAKLEITYNADCETQYNVHVHAVVDSKAPIPQVLLSMMWEFVSGFPICDVRKARDNYEIELLKYITKPWEVPDELFGEFLWALKDRKKVWVWGDIELNDESVCPYCGKSDCRARYADKVDIVYFDSSALSGFGIAISSCKPVIFWHEMGYGFMWEYIEKLPSYA